MNKLARHALTYFATAGIASLIIGGLLLFTLIDKYNDTRTIDVAHASATLLALALGQTLLNTGIVAYVSTRRSYMPPPLPPIPQARTVALIPAYNEEQNIAAAVKEAKNYVDLVIVVDDGSTDTTAKRAEQAGALVIKHPHNMGYGAAVLTLMHAALKANADYAVLLDADGQHDPKEIPKFIQALQNGADIAIGNRFTQSNVPAYRKLGIAIIRQFLRLFGVKTNDPENGYRAFTRKALETLTRELQETWMGISSQTVYIASHKKMKIAEVPTRIKYGPATSSENPFSHGLSILWTITWTWLTENPARTLAIGIAFLALSVTLLSYVSILFNTARYIRLTYTTLAILSEITATILISISLASTIKT
jgi:hypothetical protein